jgi:outer membrane lipoprotein carrier protein
MIKAFRRPLSVTIFWGRFSLEKRCLFLRLGYLVLVWICLTSAPSSSQTSDLNTLIDKIQQTYEHTSALTADFVQVATLTSLNRQQTSAGHVYIEKPHAIRWEYTQPDAQTILYDGTTLRVYTPKRHQLLQSVVDESNRTNVALLFLAGIGKLRDTFEVTPLASSDPQLVYLVLVPRSRQAGFSELHIAVNTQSFFVEKLLIHDSIGNLTEIRLSSLKVHTMLPAKTFELVLPPDTEILTPTDFTGPK